MSQQTPNQPRTSDIRLRGFVAALVLIPLDQYWVLMMEKVRSGPYPTTISIFANAIFILALLVFANRELKRFKPEWAFTSAEMLLIYTMVAVSAALAGHDMLPTVVGMMGHPWQFATEENNWARTFIPYLPKWLSVTNAAALKGLYEGDSSLYSNGFWRLWLKPCLWWLSFTVVLVWVMMCINTIVRKQWTDRERLTFPIVQLPIAMTEPAGEIWRSRLFWLGAAIAAGIGLINGLRVYIPAIPGINVGFEDHDLASGLVNKPWNAIGWLPYSFYPFVIGLGYLLPADLSFSCWFFYLFWKMQKVAASAMGWDAVPGFPYERHQALGGIVAILLTLVWTSRGYLKQVWLRIVNRKSELDDSREPMSYRAALIGALAGFLYLAGFMIRIGMSPLIAAAVFVIYFVMAIAIARIRAELGPPVHDFHFSGPDFVLTSSTGIGWMGKGDYVGLAYLYWFNRAYRSHPMPIGTEGLKMADSARASQRKFLWGIMLAVAFGTIATFWAYLHVGYKLGFSAGVSQGGVYANGAFRNLSYWWTRPPDALGPDWRADIAAAAGFLFCAALSYVRLSILNIPFHPIGYVVSASYEINLVWAPMAIAWLIKTTLLKFGGLRWYKSALPFFLGLMLGEMVVGCAWSIIGIAFNIPYYSFWGA